MNMLETALKSLKKQKEMIFFSFQLVDAVNRRNVSPEMFESNLAFPAFSEEGGLYQISLAWKNKSEAFKETAEDAHIYIVNYAILTAKENYPSILWVKKYEDNPNLYSAQNILKNLRNNFGHIKVSGEKDCYETVWDIKNEKDRRLFEIKDEEVGLKLSLNLEELNEKQFKLSQLGKSSIEGVVNLLKIFDFLIKNIEDRLREEKCNA